MCGDDMNKDYRELEELCSLSGLSGNEDRVIRYITEKLKQFSDDVFVDYSGNVTATFYGSKDRDTSILLFGHMDEVGMMVRKITDDGYLLFERVGGPSEKTLRSQMVEISCIEDDRIIKGVVGTKSHHYTQDSEKLSVPNKYELYIDVGASCKQEVIDWGIDVGSTITYAPNFTRIGKNRIASKTLDNRAACYILLRTAEHFSRHKPNITVHLGFSVQEEFNVRGSLPMYERLKPDMVVSLDCAIACDTPDLQGLYDTKLGCGPVICYMNNYGKGPAGGLIPNPKFRKFFEKIAKEKGINYQKEVAAGVLSDASFMQMKGSEGTICAHIGIPLRYSHSPIEEIDTRDLESTIKLLEEVAMGLNSCDVFKRL